MVLSPHYPKKSKTYIQVYIDLHNLVKQICDAVAAAKIPNATLVISYLEYTEIGLSQTLFELPSADLPPLCSTSCSPTPVSRVPNLAVVKGIPIIYESTRTKSKKSFQL